MISISRTYKQLLSHQKLEGQFIELVLTEKPINGDWNWVTPALMKKLAFPRFINAYLADPK